MSLDERALDTLLDVAERSLTLAVVEGRAWVPDPQEYAPPLRRPGAAFVTLELDGRLRGCIGTLAAVEPLVVTVADRARAAALHDPRFPPVEIAEVPRLDVAVSVLSPMEPLPVRGWDELRAAVRPGVDGLLIEAGHHAATFLPSVWEQLPDATRFLDHLWLKAGLTPRSWPPGMAVWRYTAQYARRSHPRGAPSTGEPATGGLGAT